jgi:hypothetical protein
MNCSLSGELETEYRILNYCIVPITMATQEIRALKLTICHEYDDNILTIH